jgi:uncharacterized protein YecE (DUF72 family)
MSSSPSRPVIRIGPAGWSYPDWRGIVYPARKPKTFHELEYLAQFFDTVEINTSFYNPPRPNVVTEWVHQAEHNKDFQFTAKLWQRFTHERNAGPDDERVFKEAMTPLVEAGHLGALLIQFPWSFKNDPGNRQYLAELCNQFRQYPLVVEVRHSSWNQPEILEMFCELAVGFCNIDQPVIGRSIKPSQHVTAPIGYVRLHGRNYQEWFSAKDDAGERYNYLYGLEELEPWVKRIEHVAGDSRATFVITNNHARGKAVANALQLIALVSGRTVQAPASLLQEYPELMEVAAPSHSSASQIRLPFGTPSHKP